MNNVERPDRLDYFSRQWKVLSLMILGLIGLISCGIQVLLNPEIGRPVSSTALQYSLIMVLGIPIGQLLRLSQKAE